jgi:hypothetical protein
VGKVLPFNSSVDKSRDCRSVSEQICVGMFPDMKFSSKFIHESKRV